MATSTSTLSRRAKQTSGKKTSTEGISTKRGRPTVPDLSDPRYVWQTHDQHRQKHMALAQARKNPSLNVHLDDDVFQWVDGLGAKAQRTVNTALRNAMKAATTK